MHRCQALFLGALVLFTCGAAPPQPLAQSIPAPTLMLFQGSDSVLVMVSREWQAANVRHQEKLLRHGVRLAYWRDHLPPQMRMVFDALGYPTGRVLLTPVGHSEEWWYYGQLSPPLRFRDGALIDRDRFDSLSGR